MMVWTCQSNEVFEKLKSDGNHKAKLPNIFKNASLKTDAQILKEALRITSLEWMATEMRKRDFPLADGAYPVYIWKFLNQEVVDIMGNEGVLLEVNIPDEIVLWSSFAGWEYVLNYLYFGTEEKTNWFIEKCLNKKQNFFDNKPLPDESLHDELVNSWDKIFNLKESEKVVMPEGVLLVQGCIPEIQMGWVQTAVDLETDKVLYTKSD